MLSKVKACNAVEAVVMPKDFAAIIGGHTVGDWTAMAVSINHSEIVDLSKAWCCEVFVKFVDGKVLEWTTVPPVCMDGKNPVKKINADGTTESL